MITCSTDLFSIPTLWREESITVIAKEVAEISFNDPPKSPIGVLVALTITTSLIFSSPLSHTIDFGNPS
jgi:hypothetical protein